MPPVTARYTFSVMDVALIRWLERLPQGTRSRTIVDALSTYRERPTNAELSAKLDRLDAKLDRLFEMMQNIETTPQTEPKTYLEGDEPAEARRGLDRMKERFRSG